MTGWTTWRWRIAFPLTVLTLVALFILVFGTVTVWSSRSPIQRVLLIAVCLVQAVGVAASLLVCAERSDRVPWGRIGIALASFVCNEALGALSSTL